MPGIRWLKWQPRYLVNRNKLQVAAKEIEAYLEKLPVNVDVISTQTLRKALGLTVSRNYFREALETVVANIGGWELVGRSIRRLPPGFAEMFKEAA